MKLLENVLELIAPYDCVACGEEGALLCSKCGLDAFEAIPSRCYRCKKVTEDFSVCRECRKINRLSYVWVCTEYSGVAKKIIYALKFQSARSAATVIAQQMSERLPHLPNDVVVTHIPTATKRRRQRGFDHAGQIAAQLARITDLDYKPLLLRVTQTRQVGASRDVRRNQLNDAFTARSSVVGQVVLLVDDIVTTGATLESAAVELKQAGAKRVYAVTFAQK